MMIFNTRFGRLFFFSTEPQTCSYLPDREAVMLFADPNKAIDTETYGRLIDYGFRRSGDNVYRPHCRGCSACVPVRIPVAQFAPDRSQRRAFARNADLTVSYGHTEFREEHVALYHQYQRARHDAGASLRDARDQLAFLRSRFIHTSWAEFRDQGRLVMVSVVDELPQGLSAVYTFYEPTLVRRSLGVYSVVALVQECARRELPWLYLGYWIQESHKMSYKDRFQPLEAYVGGRWQALVRTPESV